MRIEYLGGDSKSEGCLASPKAQSPWEAMDPVRTRVHHVRSSREQDYGIWKGRFVPRPLLAATRRLCCHCRCPVKGQVSRGIGILLLNETLALKSKSCFGVRSFLYLAVSPTCRARTCRPRQPHSLDGLNSEKREEIESSRFELCLKWFGKACNLS